ncbi:MAG: right-handed parallel beta-helix repeat-containing protein [Anaerolineae bacterium]
MVFVRRALLFLIAVHLILLLGLTACQYVQPAPTPTDLPTLPPPTGLAALVTETDTPTAAPTATTTATATVPPTQATLPNLTPTATIAVSATLSVSATTALTATTTVSGTTALTTTTTVSGTTALATTTATPCFGSISGQVITDLNANRQIDSDEPGVLGAVLYLKNANGLAAMYTIGSGPFSFPGLVAGPYTLTEIPPAGYTLEDSGSADLNLACGATLTQNFLNLLTLAQSPTMTPTAAPTVPSVTYLNPGPRSNATGFAPFTTGPTYQIAACGSINAPGIYLLNQTLVSQWDCMQIYSDNVIFDCQGNSLNGVDGNGYGIVVHHTSAVLGRAVRNIEIRNCNMTQHRYGIFIDAADNLYIHDNNSSGNYTDTDKRNYGAFLGLVEGGGIRVNDTRGALVSNNRTDGMQAIGIDMRQSDGVIVHNNSANGNSAWGIHLYGVIYSEVSNNTATNNIRYCTWGSGVVGAGCDAGGIMIQGGSSFDVVKNNIIAGQNGNGIFIKAHDEPCGDNNTLANNKIVGALYNAIELSFCKNNKLSGNEISNSLDGIWMGFASGSQIDGGNYLHDMSNHGIISWNSQNNNVSSNRIVNSRDGLYFFSSDYKKDEFFFVPGDPSDHVSTGNCLCSNTVTNNADAAFYLNNSYKNQVTGNTLIANAINFKLEGNTSGNIIQNNNIQGGALNLAPGVEPAAFSDRAPAALTAYDLYGRILTRNQFLRALTTSSPGESFDLRWFKTKLRISLGLPAAPFLTGSGEFLPPLPGWAY